MKKVLVSGADGFFGGHLVPLLVARGYQVTATYRKQRSANVDTKVRWICVDITDGKSVCALVARLKPEAVIHLAALTIPRHSWEAIPETFRVNVGGTLSFLEALRLHAPAARFLLASTIQVYGRKFLDKEGVREDSRIWPESPYAMSKAVAELACFDYAARFGLNTVILRIANSLGRGLSPDLVFPQWCRQIVRAEKNEAPPRLETGNLHVLREFLHAKDTVAAMELLLRRGKRAHVYNASTGEVKTLQSYAAFLCAQARVPLRVVRRKDLQRRLEARRISAKGEKLRALGWRPQFSARAGLMEILEEWRER